MLDLKEGFRYAFSATSPQVRPASEACRRWDAEHAFAGDAAVEKCRSARSTQHIFRHYAIDAAERRWAAITWAEIRT